MWQKIFVLQNLEKAFSLFMFKLYNQANIKSTYFVYFFRIQTKGADPKVAPI